jgi:hypothetical protein
MEILDRASVIVAALDGLSLPRQRALLCAVDRHLARRAEAAREDGDVLRLADPFSIGGPGGMTKEQRERISGFFPPHDVLARTRATLAEHCRGCGHEPHAGICGRPIAGMGRNCACEVSA